MIGAWSTRLTTRLPTPRTRRAASSTWTARWPIQRVGRGFTPLTVALGPAVRQWDAAPMGSVRTAWVEDGRQFRVMFLWLLLAPLLVASNWDRGGWFLWLPALLCAVGLVRQGLDVFAWRPRWLARTGTRDQDGFWHQ